MSNDFIENALTRLRDDSELVALRAEKVRLTSEVRCLEAVIRSHERVDCLIVANLKSEVNRLRKAGDVLAFHYIAFGRKLFPNDPLPSSVNEWQAAKDGALTK